MRGYSLIIAYLTAMYPLLVLSSNAMCLRDREKETLGQTNWDAKGCNVVFGTYNTGFSRSKKGDLIAQLSDPSQTSDEVKKMKHVAEVIQRMDADVLALYDIDYDPAHTFCALFQKNYLAVSYSGSTPLSYPYCFQFAGNKGEVAPGFDFDGDGKKGGPGDVHAGGDFPGQSAFVLLSKLGPGGTGPVRSFQKFRWSEMNSPEWPGSGTVGKDFKDLYSPEQKNNIRLMSRNLVDVPLASPCHGDVHIILAHMTLPNSRKADQDELAEGTARNTEEIRFLADYINGFDYMKDDSGRKGGLGDTAFFVVAADLNADPGEPRSALTTLFSSPRVNQALARKNPPVSRGGEQFYDSNYKHFKVRETAPNGGRINLLPERWTSFDGYRLDYILSSKTIKVTTAGVCWPRRSHSYGDIIAYRGASNHVSVLAQLFVPKQKEISIFGKMPWWGTILIFISVLASLYLCGLCGWRYIQRKQREAIEADEAENTYAEMF